MKASVHVSSDKSLRLRESKACHATPYWKKAKRATKNSVSIFYWFVSYILNFFILTYFIFIFPFIFKLPSALDILLSTLAILPSTLDSRQLETLYNLRSD